MCCGIRTTLAAALPVLLIASAYEILLRPRFEVYKEGAILITGASSGIGKHAAIHLAGMGYTVFAGVRSDSKAKKLSEQAPDPKLIPVVIDVQKEDTIENTKQKISEWMETENMPFVGLVNNAGVGEQGGEDFVDAAQRVFDVNVFGVLRVTKAFSSLLSNNNGRIVNIGSLAGLWATKNMGYSASKYALEGITDSLRLVLQPKGISVSIVQPGFVASNMCQGPQCSASPQVTTDVIVNALTNERPKSRYPCADVTGIPGWVIAFMGNHLPDVLKDAIVKAMM